MTYYNLALLKQIEREARQSKSKRCVFISHKNEDKEAAIAIGNYLTDIVGIDIYLDINDDDLSVAVENNNDQKIVDAIQVGLDCSSHLLCIISENTKSSWWVPYELGYADKQEVDIAILKLKDVEDIPSYLKIKKTLYDVDDFLRYASGLVMYSFIIGEKCYADFSTRDNIEIKKYLD